MRIAIVPLLLLLAWSAAAAAEQGSAEAIAQSIADYPTGPGFVTKDAAASVIDLSKQGKR